MKPTTFVFVFLFSALRLLAAEVNPHSDSGETKSLLVSFTENKGQMSDQFYRPRLDVRYGGSIGDMTFHLRNKGISYQFIRAGNSTSKVSQNEKSGSIYRVDVNWIGCKDQAEIVTDKEFEGYTNYYLAACPAGALNVKSYKGITYKQIFPGIDLHYYSKQGSLKYDFLVEPFANPQQIRMEILGATKIELLSNGSVIIITPFGEIKEEAPLVYQGNKKIWAAWKIDGNTLSFRLGKFDPSKALLIDPVVRVWGTFYGGSLLDQGYHCTTSGTDVYMSGWSNTATGTNIATVGSHQATLNVNGNTLDAFLVKFDQAGNRLWGTYYGDSGTDRSYGCAADASGNIYMCGTTATGTILSTTGAHQTAHGGGTNDAFLVKFNGSGMRLWGTYYGGSGDENGASCVIDGAGNVILTGGTSSTGTIISTSGSHQITLGGSSDGFVVKFDNTGLRLWGTYYGGSAAEDFLSCAIDLTGNIYLCGNSNGSGAAVVTTGAHQTSQGGVTDALLVKLNPSGVRQWATLYGGTAIDYGYSVACDPSGNVFIAGTTQSTAGIVFASSGAHQSTHAGSGTPAYDAFLAKFDPTGLRLWGTYYGDIGTDTGLGCATDLAGNVYICGGTATGSGTPATVLATLGSQQTVMNNNGYGGSDAYIAKFNTSGARVWGSYYGCFSGEAGYSCTVDASGAIYMCGFVGNTNVLGSQSISSPNGFQLGYGGGGGDGFLVKFADCAFPAPPLTATSPSNQLICAGYTATLSATATGVVRWYQTATSTGVLGTGTSIAIYMPSPGTYTYYAAALTCAENNTRTAITLTVLPSPTLAASNGTSCAGSPFIISPSGASTYSINGGSFTVSPSSTSHFSVTGTGTNGCVSPNPYIVTLTVYPLPTVTVNSGFICIGGTYTIQPTGGISYSISGNSFTVNPTSTNTYTVIGSDLKGCVSASVISTVTVNNVFPNVTVNSGTLCPGKTFTINPSGALYYVYSSSSPTVSPLLTSNYTVTGYASNSCAATAISNVSVISLPLNMVALPAMVCKGQSATLSASGASTYSWSTASTSSSISVTPLVTAHYMVTGTDFASGCSLAVVKSVSVLPVPSISLVSSNSVICRGETATLTAIGAGSFSWSTYSQGNTSIVTPSSTTSYTVSTTGSNGCIGTATLKQTVDFCLGFEESFERSSGLVIYPNPTNGKFYIETSTVLDVVILNSLGQIISFKSLLKGLNDLSLLDQAAGIYFIVPQENSEVKTLKIIKQ